MKWLFNILGILLIAFGTLWILQGTNVLKGGMMGGHLQYAVLGVVTLAIGILLLRIGNRRSRISS